MDNKSIYNNTSVIELNKSDFNRKKVKHIDFEKKNGLIVFYAPWCKHCKNMKDMWENLASTFKYQFAIAAVNVEDTNKNNGKLLKTFNISIYPTIKYVTKTGTVIKYEGIQNYDDIVYFIWNKILVLSK
tara:strand:+ start:13200 stop:13586 length:387 start_codon:yes stop_codon:yes gene_type:complete